MNKTSDNQYSYGEIMDFIPIPRLFMTHPAYRSLSSEAKIIYGLFMERMGESGMKDEENYSYIHYPEYEIQELMNISEDTLQESLGQLDKYTGIGLIFRKKGTLDKPTRIYLTQYGSITPDFEQNTEELPVVEVPSKEEYQAKLKAHEKKNSGKILNFSMMGV